MGEQDLGGSVELVGCELLDGITDELEEGGTMLSLLTTSFKTTLITCTFKVVNVSGSLPFTEETSELNTVTESCPMLLVYDLPYLIPTNHQSKANS